MKVGISPRKSNSVCSFIAALVLLTNPEHRRFLSIQDRNHPQHTDLELRVLVPGQSRCKSANLGFHLHRPMYFGTPFFVFPYGRAFRARPEDSTQYPASFHGKSVERTPYIEAGRSM